MPDIGYANWNEYESKLTGRFVKICNLLVNKLRLEISESTISEYIKGTVRQNRNLIKKTNQRLLKEGKTSVNSKTYREEIEKTKQEQKNKKS